MISCKRHIDWLRASHSTAWLPDRPYTALPLCLALRRRRLGVGQRIYSTQLPRCIHLKAQSTSPPTLPDTFQVDKSIAAQNNMCHYTDQHVIYPLCTQNPPHVAVIRTWRACDNPQPRNGYQYCANSAHNPNVLLGSTRAKGECKVCSGGETEEPRVRLVRAGYSCALLTV